MTQILKADTLVKVVIGPVVAVGDGFTPVTTLALTTADEAELLKHDAAAVTDISGNTFAAITSADGYYNLTLTAAQLDTEGLLTVLVNDDSLCLPVKATFMVVSANVYDSLFAAAGTDVLQVDATQVDGNAAAAVNLHKSALTIVTGAAAAGTLSTTEMTTDLTEATNNHYNGRTVLWLTGVLAGQGSPITAYDGTAKKLTFDTITEAPGVGDEFVIL